MIPGRQRMRSNAEDEPIPERVYEILRGFDKRVEKVEDTTDRLEHASQKNEIQNSQIIKSLEDIKATDRHALTKLAVGLATTALVTIGGVVGGIQATKTTVDHAPVVQRSALDMALDQCRPIQEAGTRAECFSRVFAEVQK